MGLEEGARTPSYAPAVWVLRERQACSQASFSRFGQIYLPKTQYLTEYSFCTLLNKSSSECHSVWTREQIARQLWNIGGSGLI